METRLIVTIDSRGAVSGSNSINSSLDGVRRNARGMVDDIDGSFNKLRGSLFSLRGAILSLGIGEFLRRSVVDFMEFETGLVKIGKTANISGDALKEMGNTITEMSTRIPVARTELLSIAEAAGQLGITGSAQITKFTETIAKLGTASNLKGEEAATTIARILGNTRESFDNADRLSSVIVKLGNDSNATESEIAKMAIEISKATVQFKVSSVNLAALGTTFATFGQQPELARSSIMKTFLALQQASQQGGKDLQLLGKLAGMTGAQFKQAFEKDSFDAFVKFTAGLKGVKDAGGSITNVLAAIGLNGTEINAVLPLLAENMDVFQKNIAAANLEFKENTALNKEAEAAFSTLQSKLMLLNNQFKIVTSTIGAELRPGLITIADKLIQLAESDRVIQFAHALGTAFSFLADNIDLVGIALAAISTVKLIGLFASLAGSVFGAGNALRLGAAEALRQSAALGTLASNANLGVGGLNRIALSTDILSTRTKIATIATYLFNTALGALGIRSSTVASLLSGLGVAAQRTGGILASLPAGIAGMASTIGGTVARFAAMAAGSQLAAIAVRGLALAFGILTGPIGITIAVITGLVVLYQVFKDSIISVGTLHASLGNTIQAAWTVTTQAIGAGVSAAGSAISSWFNSIWEQAVTIFTAVRTAITERFLAIKDTISSTLTSVIGYFSSFFQPVAAVFTQIKDVVAARFLAIRDSISEKITEITQFFRTLVEQVTTIFSSIKDSIVQSFTGAFDTVKTHVSEFVDNTFGGFIDKIIKEANRLQTAENKLKDVGTAAQNTASKVREAAAAVDGKPASSPTASGKTPAVSSPSTPAAPAAGVPTVNLKEINTLLDSGNSKASNFSQTLDGMLTSANREGLSLQMNELQKQLAEVDNRVIDEVGSFDKLTKKQLESVEATKLQITANYNLQVTLKEQQDAREKLKQVIEETRTPQEKYNTQIEELNRLNPQTAEGIEAVRRRVAELGQELRGTNELTKQFNADFESTFKKGLEGVMRNGKGGFKDMLSGFKDLYFKTVTEIAAKPILDAVLGPKSASSGTTQGTRSGGLFSSVFDGLFNTPTGKPANSNLPPLAPGEKEIQGMPWLNGAGDTIAKSFTADNGGGGFVSKLGDVFGNSSNSSGFLGGISSLFGGTNGGGFLGGLSQLFGASGGGGFLGSLSSMFSSMGGGGGMGGGGQGGGAGSILGTIGGIVGNMFMPGVGGMIGSGLGSMIGGFFADGGSVKKDVPIVVGERGAELFIPPSNGEIISNEVLKSSFGSKAIQPMNDNIQGIPDDIIKGAAQAHMAGNFAGFFAGGGSVSAGSTIVGGEKGVELFVPEKPATVSVKSSEGGGKGGDTIVVNITVNTPDAATFRRSQGQIMAEAAAAMQRAKRNL